MHKFPTKRDPLLWRISDTAISRPLVGEEIRCPHCGMVVDAPDGPESIEEHRAGDGRYCNGRRAYGQAAEADGRPFDGEDDLPPIESDDYGKPCPECPKRGRIGEAQGVVDSDHGCCCICLGDQTREAMAAPEEDRERWVAMAEEPRYPR